MFCFLLKNKNNKLLSLYLWQESGRHADTLDAITRYLDMGTYSEWDEEKKLDFLTRELKGKRPLVPLRIEVRCLDSDTWTMVMMLQSFKLCEMKISITKPFILREKLCF